AKILHDLDHNPEKVLNVPEGKSLEDVISEHRGMLASTSGDVFFCQIHNPTSKVAIGVDAIHYNSESRNFISASRGLELIAEKSTESTMIIGKAMNQDEAIREARETYGNLPSI